MHQRKSHRAPWMGGTRTQLKHNSWRGDIDETCREASLSPKDWYKGNSQMTGLSEEAGIATAFAWPPGR